MNTPFSITCFFALTLSLSCNVKECPRGFDFTVAEKQLIPYKRDSLLVFKNEQGLFDTFHITSRIRRIIDKGVEIETSSNDWLEMEIRYTNKNFDNNPDVDRQLVWITKGCKSKDFGISASWMDYWDGLHFVKGDTFESYTYPETIKKFPFDGDTLTDVLRFQTDTIKWEDAIQREVKIVYWLRGEGVIMYETRTTGTWKKIR